MAEILREALPDATISTSSGVLPELFEHERFSTTVANAVLSPLVSGYVAELDQRLKDDGYEGDLLILHSGGGVMTPEAVQELAVRLAASGIAAGAVAARHTAALCGHEQRDRRRHGRHEHRHLARLRRRSCARPTSGSSSTATRSCFPSIEVLTIGAGGGSLAKIDAAGSLRNGPQSAGSRPGPGRLRPGRRGADEHRRQPRPRPARRRGWSAAACRSIATPPRRRSARRSPSRWTSTCTRRPTRSSPSPTRTWPTRCGSSRCSAATTRASSRWSSSAAPGRCTAPRWPRSSGVPTVLVPPRPGTWSALGCLMVDIRHDLSEMFLRPGRRRRRGRARRGVRAPGGRRAASCSPSEGVAEDDVTLERSIAMRYLGQWRSLEVAVRRATSTPPSSASTPSTSASSPTAATTRRSSSTGSSWWPPARPRRSSCREHDARRRACPSRPRRRDGVLRRRGASRRPSTSASDLPAGVSFEGPAVIDQLDTTTLVPPGVRGRGRRVAQHP